MPSRIEGKLYSFSIAFAAVLPMMHNHEDSCYVRRHLVPKNIGRMTDVHIIARIGKLKPLAALTNMRSWCRYLHWCGSVILSSDSETQWDVCGTHAHVPLIGRLESDENDIRRCLCAHLSGPPPVYLLGKPAVSFTSKHHLRLADCWTCGRERATPTDKDPYRHPVYR